MKLVVFEDSALASFGGGQKVTLALLESTPSQVEIYLVDTDGDSDFFQQSRNYCKSALNLNNRKNRFYGSGNNFSITSFTLISMMLILPIQVLKTYRFLRTHGLLTSSTIFYAPTKVGAVLALLFSCITRGRFVFHAHNCFGGSTFSEKAFTKFVVNKASTVIAVSDYVKNSLPALSSVTRVYNPVTMRVPEIFEARQYQNRSLRVGTCCSLIEYKGVRVYLDAVRQISRSKFDIDAVVIGGGPLLEELRREHGDHVTFVGQVSNVDAFFEHLDVLIVPSIEPDAFSLVIMEAMAKGVAVIATDIGAHSELINDFENGVLIPASSPSAIIEVLEMLSRDVERLKSLCEHGHAFALEFSKRPFDEDVWSAILGASGARRVTHGEVS